MSEEIPPSSLTTRPAPASVGGSGDVLHTLRLTDTRWRGLAVGTPVKGAATVVGAWFVLAWNRFGFQGLEAPRSVTRFLLVGVYSWLAMALVVWLGAVVRDRMRGDDGSRGSQAADGGAIDPLRVLRVTGMAHQPLVIFAVLLQIGQAIPIPGLTTVGAVATILLWMPAMLVAATAGALRRGLAIAAPMALGGFGVWLVTGGRYLLDRVGHLI